MAGVWITSRYPTHCVDCRASIRDGDRVLWSRSPRWVRCRACGTTYEGSLIIDKAALQAAADRTIVDSLTGLDLATVYGGSNAVFTSHAHLMASKYLGDLWAHRYDKLQNIGAARGCKVCETTTTVDQDHLTTWEHLRAQWPGLTDPQILSLHREAQQELTIETENWLPTTDGKDQGAIPGWRGFVLSIGAEGVRLKGAKGVVWESAKMAGECLATSRYGNPREACLTHIGNGGRIARPSVEVRTGRRGLELLEAGSTSECLCGIYGYHEAKGLAKLGPEFNVMTQVLGYGTVAIAEDGFKASDAKLMRAWIVMSHVRSALDKWHDNIQYLTKYVDWARIAAELNNHYQIPVQIVEDWTGIYDQLEMEASMSWLTPR